MSLFTLILVLVALGVVLGIALTLNLQKSARKGFETDSPFYARKLMTAPEQVLFHRLAKALPECIVLTQVQLSRVVGVKKRIDAVRYANQISQKSLDFVVCLRDGTIVAAIELDDASHNRPERKFADRTKNGVLKAAGVPLIRWHVNAMPDEAGIRKAIAGDSL